MKAKQRIMDEIATNARQIERLKYRNNKLRADLWLMNERIRPRVFLIKQKKIDGLIKEMIFQGISDWSAMASKVNSHGFRLEGKIWNRKTLKKYWQEKEN